MFPVLFSFGPVTITTLGVCAFLSFFFGSFFIWRKAKQEHIEDSDIFDLIFISLFTGLVGGRLGYVLSHFAEFGMSFNRWVDPVASHGFAWFGFLVGFMVGVKLVSDKKKWEFFEIADMSVVGMIVSQLFLRVGQFFDSSFVGSATNLPWGMPFPGFDSNRHPLSLYEIPVLFFLLLLVKYVDKHYRLYRWYRGSRGEAKPGFLWLSYLFVLTLFHMLLDLTFERQTLILIISYRQVWLLGMLALTMFWFWWQKGDSFDVWKLREKWFGTSEKEKYAPVPRQVVQERVEPQSDINSEERTSQDIEPIETVVVTSTGNTQSSGKRFFRTRK